MMEMESSQTTTTASPLRRSSVDVAINQIYQQYNRTNTSSTHEHQNNNNTNNTPWWQFNNRRASSVSEEEVEKERDIPATWWKMNRRTTCDTRATVETVNNGWWLKRNDISRSEELDDSLVSDRVDVSERSKEGGNSISSVVVEEKELNVHGGNLVVVIGVGIEVNLNHH